MKFVKFIIVSSFLFMVACSSPQYKTQPLGSRETSKTLEYDYDIVWRGIRDSLAQFKIEEADEEDGEIETDWAYSTSTTKFIELKVNGKPRRKYLQNRYRYFITAKKQIIGVQVSVVLKEEIERLNLETGAFEDWDSVSEENLDTHKAHKMLENIENTVLSGRHIKPDRHS